MLISETVDYNSPPRDIKPRPVNGKAAQVFSREYDHCADIQHSTSQQGGFLHD